MTLVVGVPIFLMISGTLLPNRDILKQATAI